MDFVQRLRCIKGWHRLSEYKPAPFVREKTNYNWRVVRAAHGICDECKKDVFNYTPATPKWQRGNKYIHIIYKFIRGK